MPALILARLLGPQSYGTFSLAFLAWFLVLAVIRSGFMQPYTLVASSLELPEWRDLTSRASGLVVAAGATASGTFAMSGFLVGISSELGRSLLAVAVLAPGLVLQEFWRSASFVSRRAKTAAANDFYWAVGQALAFAAVLTTVRITAAESLLAWGAGAWLAAALGALQLSVTPRIGRDSLQLAREWLRLGSWFTGANVTFSAGLFGAAAIIAAELGPHSLGLFRMVEGNLFGPVQLVLIAAASVFVPHLARSSSDLDGRALRAAFRYSAGIAITVAGYGGVLMLVAPVLLDSVFGSAFEPATSLILPMLVSYTVDAAGNGAALLLQVQRRGRSLLIMQLAATSLQLLAVIMLVRTNGVLGAAWGVAIGSGVATVVGWALALGPSLANGRRTGSLATARDLRPNVVSASQEGVPTNTTKRGSSIVDNVS